MTAHIPDRGSIRDQLDALAETDWAAELNHPERQRQRIFDALASEDDPLLREIGEQLADGRISPRHLLTVPGYESVLDRQLECVRQMDTEALQADLRAALDAALKQERHRWS